MSTDPNWCDLDIDHTAKTITLTQKWKYIWYQPQGNADRRKCMLPWDEKTNIRLARAETNSTGCPATSRVSATNRQTKFKNLVQKRIDNSWGNVTFKVARRQRISANDALSGNVSRQGRPETYAFNIKIVDATDSSLHWTVTVRNTDRKLVEVNDEIKVRKNHLGSSVHWGNRTMTLDYNDNYRRTRRCGTGTPPPRFRQRGIEHEAGHFLGYTSSLVNGSDSADEYDDDHPHASDCGSIMHRGSTIKQRHFVTIIKALRAKAPNYTFRVEIP